MAFDQGFQKVASMDKEAFLGTLASLAGRGLMGVAKPLAGAAVKGGGMLLRGANAALGGTLGTVMTGAQAVGDYKNYKNQMNSALR